MFITTHSAIGVAATTALGVTEPAMAFTIGWLLHYVGDAIPHGDERLGAWCMHQKNPARLMGLIFAVDLLVVTSIFTVVSLVQGFSWTVLFAAAGSMVPDVLFGFEMVLGHRTFSWLTRLHNTAHKLTGVVFSLKIGLPLQISVATMMWLIVLN